METSSEINAPLDAKKITVLNNAMKYGLYTSVAYVLVTLLYYAFNLMLNQWLNFLSYIVLIAGIVLATLNYRNKINGGFISYGKGVTTGVIVGLIVGIVMAIFTWVFYTYIHPAGLQEMMEMAEQAMLDKGLSDEMIDQQMSMTGKMMKMPIINFLALGGYTFWGLIISLITSAILKKNDDSFNTTFNQ